MNYDTIKNLNLKYELIDKNKSYSYHTDDGTHIIELYLLDENPRQCHPSLPQNIYIN